MMAAPQIDGKINVSLENGRIVFNHEGGRNVALTRQLLQDSRVIERNDNIIRYGSFQGIVIAENIDYVIVQLNVWQHGSCA